MQSPGRLVVLVAAAGLVGASAASWAGCSSAADPSSDTADATTDAPDEQRQVDATPAVDAADAAPFVTAPHRPWPELLPYTGRVLHPMTLVTIVAANDNLSASLFAFSDALIASSWWKATGGEYGVGAAAASVHVNGAAITTSPTRSELVPYIQDAIGDAGAPAPNGNTLYLVYLPDGVTVTGANFESFHNAYPAVEAGAGDGFAIVSRQTPGVGETQLDQLTKVASHEIIEAATDPGLESWRLPLQTATPWTGSVWSAMQLGHVENGDLCEGTRIREPPTANGFLYQRSWSAVSAAAGDAAAGDPCVPALGGAAYNNVSVPQDWYVAAPGKSLTIPFTGWSTAATPTWLMNVAVNNSTTTLADLKLGAGLTLATTLGNGASSSCSPRQAMNNGESGTLTVAISADAVSGDWAVLSLHSFRAAAKCNQAPDDDLRHSWLVGVYVP